MRAEEKNMVERIMDTETMGYAYEYPYGGGARKEYMLALTPENLANFIGARGYDAKKIVITDVLDRLIVNTCMGMLDVCPDQKLCGRIIEYLAPIQLGEKEAGEILAERLLFYHLLEITVCSGKDPDIHFYRLSSADPLKFLLL